MSYSIIRNVLCIVVEQNGERSTFFVRERKIEDGPTPRYQCELTIQSSFGNVGYFWNAMAVPACQFFDRTDSSYLLGKLFGERHMMFCGETTIINLKRKLFRELRHENLDSGYAREIYTALQEISPHANDEREMFDDMTHDIEFDRNRESLMDWINSPSDIPWGRRINPQAEGLWKLWPEFVRALNEEALRPRDIVP